MTLLPSGRVLIRGGALFDLAADGSGSISAVEGPDEIFDPVTGRFASVLAAGPREPIPTIVLLNSGRIERYDLRTGAATDITPELPETIVEFGPHCRDHQWVCRSGWTLAQLDDGRVLLAGGNDTAILPPDSEKRWTTVVRTAAEVFDPDQETTAPTGVMVQPRVAHTATLLADGRVLLIGGERGRQDVDTEPRVFLSSAEIYTPAR